MILKIAAKEITNTVRDRRFHLGVVTLLVLLLLALGVGWHSYRENSALQRAAQASQREQFLNRKAANAHIAAHGGMTVFRPYNNLSIIDEGLDSYVGTSIFLEAHRSNDYQNRPAERTAAVNRFGELTVALVLQLFVPLLIILLTYAAFAGEREQGTLRQVMSLGLHPRDFALGKALGVSVPLLLILIPAALLGVLALALSSSTLSASLPRMVWLSLGYTVYFVIFVSLGLCVSARTRNSQRALITLLGFWLVTCLIFPRLAADLGERIYSTAPPPEKTFADASEQAHSFTADYLARTKQLEAELLQKYNVKTRAELPVSVSALMLYRSEEEDTKAQRKKFTELFNQYQKQNRLFQSLGIFAPALAIQSVSMGLVGSDVAHFRHFAEQAEEYRYQMAQKLNEDLINHPFTDFQANRIAYHTRERAVYESIAPFEYAMPDWRWSAGHLVWPCIVLTLWLLGMLIAIGLFVARMRID